MKSLIPLPGKSLWAGLRSKVHPQRDDGTAESDHDPHSTELPAISNQQSLSFSSEIIAKEDPVQVQTLLSPSEASVLGSTNQNSDAPISASECGISKTSNLSWIEGIYLCGYATASLLLLNIILVSVIGGFSSKFPGTGGSSNSKVIYDGSCNVASRWDTGIHVIINIISTCTLAASNYCMQALVAPTRQEIDLAHAKRRWLHIGGSGFRNLFAISHTRLGLWIILLLTATPFHLLYNSLVFESVNYNHFWTFAAPHDFDPKDVRNLTTPALQECFETNAWDSIGRGTRYPDEILNWDQQIAQTESSEIERVSTEECHKRIYKSNSQSGYKGFIVLTSNRSMSDTGTKAILRIDGWAVHERVEVVPFVILDPKNTQSHRCSSSNPFYNHDYDRENVDVTECLALKEKDNCQLFYSPIIAAIIIVVTFVKAIAIFCAARIRKGLPIPLLTSGDAIASFLEDPDETTKGMCWVSLYNIKKNWIAWPEEQGPQRNTANYQHLAKPQQWRKASGAVHWLITVGIIIASILTTLTLYPFAVVELLSGLGSGYFTWKAIWDSEYMAREQMGTTVTGGSVQVTGRQYSELQGVVIANSAQFIITLCYYFYNSLLTRMLLSAEYSSYGVERKPLRVTWPTKGSQQRTTYWLSIPYRYGIPSLLLFTILHWLVSQGIYFVLGFPYDTNGNMMYELKTSRPLFSYMPLSCAGVLLAILGIMIIAVSFRRLKSEIPLAGTCSAAISASCHVPESARTDTVAHCKLMWGETDAPLTDSPLTFTFNIEDQYDNDNDHGPKGHCSFTPSEARKPSREKVYA